MSNREQILSDISKEVCKLQYISEESVKNLLNMRIEDYLMELIRDHTDKNNLLLISLEEKRMKLAPYSDEWVLLLSKTKRIKLEAQVATRMLNESRIESKWKKRYEALRKFVTAEFSPNESLRRHFETERDQE